MKTTKLLCSSIVVLLVLHLCGIIGTGTVAAQAPFPPQEQIDFFVDHLNNERFFISSDSERTMTGSADFTDGLIIAQSPGWLRWLGKAVIVTGTTVGGGAVGSLFGPGGTAVGARIGAGAGVNVAFNMNCKKAYSPAVVDVGLFESIDVPTLGDIAPNAVSMVLSNVTSTYVLDQWNDKVPGTSYRISFSEVFAGRVIDSLGVEKSGPMAIPFVLEDEISGEQLFGMAYFNMEGNLRFSDRFDIDFGTLIPGSLDGSPVDYRAGGLIAYPEIVVPALTNWGLLVLFLLLVASAIYVIYQRRKGVVRA